MQRATDDIAHLYHEFGGKPQNYRELTRTREAERARERWPLISRLEDLPAGAPVPPVRAGEDTGAEPLRLEDTAAAPAAAAAFAPVHRAQPEPEPEPEPERIEPTLAPHRLVPGVDEAHALPWLRQAVPAAPQAEPLPTHASMPPRHRPAEPAPLRVAAASATTAQPVPTRAFAHPAQTPAAQQATVAPMFAALHRGAQPDEAPVPAPARMFAPLRAQPTAPAEVRPPAPASMAAARSAAWRSPPAPASSPGSAQDSPAALPRAAARAGGPESLALQGESPLSRLGQAQPAHLPAKRPGGLQSLFARLLGRDDS